MKETWFIMLLSPLMNKEFINKIIYDNEVYEFSVRYSKRKTVEIKIEQNGQILVSAPFYMSIDDIKSIVYKKVNWIRDKIKLINENSIFNKSSLLDKEHLPYFGIEVPFYKHEKNSAKVNLRYDNKAVEIFIPQGFNMSDTNSLIEVNLKKMYTQLTKKYLDDRLKYFESLIGVRAVNIRVKDQKSRWGSCSSKHNLNFNFRLSMTPLNVFDYVIVHELCHIKEMR